MAEDRARAPAEATPHAVAEAGARAPDELALPAEAILSVLLASGSGRAITWPDCLGGARGVLRANGPDSARIVLRPELGPRADNLGGARVRSVASARSVSRADGLGGAHSVSRANVLAGWRRSRRRVEEDRVPRAAPDLDGYRAHARSSDGAPAEDCVRMELAAATATVMEPATATELPLPTSNPV